MTAPKVRAAWLDRFKAPTADEMLGAFNRQMQGALQHLREKLLAVEGVKEEVSWQGVWRWTLVYRIPGDGERGWAYLVLDPAKPRVSVPITDDIIAELPVKKLS